MCVWVCVCVGVCVCACVTKSLEMQFSCSNTHVYVHVAITSVLKIRFQQFKHFSVAFNELFHMVHLPKKKLSTQIWLFFMLALWIYANVLLWVENHFCVEHTMWKSSLLAVYKCSNCWKSVIPNWSYGLSNFNIVYIWFNLCRLKTFANHWRFHLPRAPLRDMKHTHLSIHTTWQRQLINKLNNWPDNIYSTSPPPPSSSHTHALYAMVAKGTRRLPRPSVCGQQQVC